MTPLGADDLANLLLLVHAGSTFFMTGLIWFVQIVHYPMFALVGVDQFVDYEQVHQRRTTWVVGPVMIIELVTGVALVVCAQPDTARVVLIVGLILLALIWISTAFVQVPLHRLLETGLDVGIVRRLVATNWVRTVLWTTRAFLIVWLFV